MFSLGSCEDTNDLGIDLPGTVPIDTNYEDFSVVAPIQGFTVKQDSLATTQKNHFIVGRLQDSNTGGLIEAKAFLEVAPSAAASDSLPSQYATQTLVLDSVVMLAAFDRVYGRTTQPVKLSVYELQQPLDDFQPYNSKSELPLGPAIVTDQVVNLNRTIRTKNTGLDSIQGLPIRLPLYDVVRNQTAFGTRLFNKLKGTSTVYLSDQDLRDVWKGMALLPASTGTAIAFNRSPLSQIYVYYHYMVGTAKKNKVFRLLYGDPFSSTAAPRYFTNINYNLSSAGSPFGSLQSGGPAQVAAAASAGVVYAQDGTGLVTKLLIPGLDTLRNRQAKRNLTINRAELIIPVKPYSTLQFAAPSRLYLFEANKDNNRPLIYRNGLTTAERLVQQDGFILPTSDKALAFTFVDAGANTKYYTGLMTTYVQAYAKNQLSGPTPTAFLLSPTVRRTGGDLTLDRAAIDAQNIKLRVYYSNATAR
ncbi:hypothetical protein GCM10027048_08280 [Hymenobacter coalescens]